MGSSILRATREIISDLMDKDGNYYEKPKGRLGQLNLEKKRMDFIYSYVDFVLNSNCLCEFTKQYLFGLGSVRGFAESYNSILGDKQKRVNEHSAQSKIFYDKSKLEKLFSKSMVTDVLYLHDDISAYEEKLLSALVRYTKWGGMRDSLILQLPRDYMNAELSDQEFHELIQTITPYTKRYIRNVEKSISQSMVGYFNFLISGKGLQGADLERFNMLKNILEEENS